MIFKITQDYKFRNRYFRFSTKKENILMTRLILSKSFLPEGTNTLAKQQTLFTSHAPPMQVKCTLPLRYRKHKSQI